MKQSKREPKDQKQQWVKPELQKIGIDLLDVKAGMPSLLNDSTVMSFS